jgi:hypothetical protein
MFHFNFLEFSYLHDAANVMSLARNDVGPSPTEQNRRRKGLSAMPMPLKPTEALNM